MVNHRSFLHALYLTRSFGLICPTWHYQVWQVLSFSNISQPVLLKFGMCSLSTSHLRFKIFKGPIWHDLFNVVHQILLSMGMTKRRKSRKRRKSS